MKKIFLIFILLLNYNIVYQQHNIIKIKKNIDINKYINIKYKWGGDNINGFDCSGFVKYFYFNEFNINLPRTASQQCYKSDSYIISKYYINENIKNYDLIFFKYKSNKINHVAIYLNNSLLHSRGGKGVIIDSINSVYFNKIKKYIYCIKRVKTVE